MARSSLLQRVVALGFDETRARSLIMAGRVFVNGDPKTQAGTLVSESSVIDVREPSPYPGRGAHKLAGALSDSGLAVAGRVALDLGAAHGGFTQVLLEHGALHVYAVDVAYGMLDYRLREDPRVSVLERHNVRALTPQWFSTEHLNSPLPWIVSADLAFISMRSILPVLADFAKLAGIRLEGLLLIKPQFEDSRATNSGVLQDEQRRAEIVALVAAAARQTGLEVLGEFPSKLPGSHGNQEVFLHVRSNDALPPS